MKKLLSATLAVIALGSFALPALAQGANAQEVKGNAAAGQSKIDMCIGCHGITGYKASFPEVYRVPMIGGQNAKYIAAALAEYQNGGRKFPTMHAVAVALTDQDVADIAAYYEQQGKNNKPVPAKLAKEPPANVAKLLTQGNCASCHGANFNTPIDASYPKLAGQHPDYLYMALKAYKTQNNPLIGRNNPIMMGMAAPFSHAELHVLSNYLGSLPSDLRTVQQPDFRLR